MLQSILQCLTLPFHRVCFSILWCQKCALSISRVGTSDSPSAFLYPPEKLLSNLFKMVPPDVLVPGSIQGSSSANGQAGNPTRWLRPSFPCVTSALSGHWYHKMMCPCLFIPYIDLQLLHHWVNPLSGNLPAWFETEWLIFPNLTGEV